jgi:hypothetical protein
MKKSIFVCALLVMFGACSKKEEAAPSTRSYRMGFQNSAPRFDDINLFLRSLDMWTQRADAAIINTEPPWAKLLAGESPVKYAIDNYKGLVDYYRSKNLKLWIYLDPQNGLERTQDAAELVAAGKSIAQPEIQKIFRRFAIVMDSLYKPDHLGLALETNLIRGATTPAIYNGVVKAVNDAAAEIKGRKSMAKLSVSVQADFAWGKLQGASFQGIEKDFIDFPFIEELGISSYPYAAFSKPSEIPLDYYSRLVSGKNVPVFVSEGGWSSREVTLSTGVFPNTPQAQAEYIAYHAKLLDNVNASAVFQLLFTDLDVSALPGGISPNILAFTSIGVVDVQFQPKPALGAWDNLFAKPLK